MNKKKLCALLTSALLTHSFSFAGGWLPSYGSSLIKGGASLVNCCSGLFQGLRSAMPSAPTVSEGTDLVENKRPSENKKFSLFDDILKHSTAVISSCCAKRLPALSDVRSFIADKVVPFGKSFPNPFFKQDGASFEPSQEFESDELLLSINPLDWAKAAAMPFVWPVLLVKKRWESYTKEAERSGKKEAATVGSFFKKERFPAFI